MFYGLKLEGETACRFYKITSFPLPPPSPVTRNIKDFQRHQVFEHSRFYDRNPSQRSIILIIQFKFPYSFLCIYIWGHYIKYWIIWKLTFYFVFSMEIYSQSGAFLMQNWNACVVTTAVPTPCGIFHYFTAAMNFWPSVSVILDTHGFKWQSSMLVHSFDFHSYSWLCIRTGRVHSHHDTLMTAGVAGSQWALFLLKAPLTTAEELHIHQSALQL